jgi:cobalamin biosynthesis Mg chelatase CobN
MPTDCIINYDSAVDSNCSAGTKYTTYNITAFEKAGGIGCTKLIMNRENIQDETKVTIDAPNFKIQVAKTCPVEQPTISTTQNAQGDTTTTVQKPSGDTTQVTNTAKGDTIIQTTSGTGDKTTTVRDSSGNITSKTQPAQSPKSNNTMIIVVVIIILLLLGIGALLFLKK